MQLKLCAKQSIINTRHINRTLPQAYKFQLTLLLQKPEPKSTIEQKRQPSLLFENIKGKIIGQEWLGRRIRRNPRRNKLKLRLGRRNGKYIKIRYLCIL